MINDLRVKYSSAYTLWPDHQGGTGPVLDEKDMSKDDK